MSFTAWILVVFVAAPAVLIVGAAAWLGRHALWEQISTYEPPSLEPVDWRVLQRWRDALSRPTSSSRGPDMTLCTTCSRLVPEACEKPETCIFGENSLTTGLVGILPRATVDPRGHYSVRHMNCDFYRWENGQGRTIVVVRLIAQPDDWYDMVGFAQAYEADHPGLGELTDHGSARLVIDGFPVWSDSDYGTTGSPPSTRNGAKRAAQ